VKDTKIYFDVMNMECIKHVNRLEVGKEYYIFKEISNVTLKILGECIFGASFLMMSLKEEGRLIVFSMS